MIITSFNMRTEGLQYILQDPGVTGAFQLLLTL